MLSTRKPWSSDRCQWKTFSFTASIPSRLRSITGTGMKWRPASIISPRHGKRGWSSMAATGTLKPWGVTLTSCRKVCNPCSTPSGFAAVSSTWVAIISRRYDSSSTTCCTGRLGPAVLIVKFACFDCASPRSGIPVSFESTSRKRSLPESSLESVYPSRAMPKLPSMRNCPSPCTECAGRGITGSVPSSWARIAGAAAQTAEETMKDKAKRCRQSIFKGVSPGCSHNAVRIGGGTHRCFSPE